ncbi:MAG: CBS domain-containing protein [Candidatus Omnitrophica bacterium]|nr:CBS domain-containing protein [Candidatus Omnitrophota bacterium]
MRDVPLKEIMVTHVITASPADSLSSIEEKMRTHRIRHIPIVDGDRKLVGIITHRDLLWHVQPHKTEEGYYFDKEQMDRFILKYIMTPDPDHLRPDNTLLDAIDIMVMNKYGCIPIADAGKTLLGIVTPIDVLRYVYRVWKSS